MEVEPDTAEGEGEGGFFFPAESDLEDFDFFLTGAAVASPNSSSELLLCTTAVASTAVVEHTTDATGPEVVRMEDALSSEEDLGRFFFFFFFGTFSVVTVDSRDFFNGSKGFFVFLVNDMRNLILIFVEPLDFLGGGAKLVDVGVGRRVEEASLSSASFGTTSMASSSSSELSELSEALWVGASVAVTKGVSSEAEEDEEEEEEDDVLEVEESSSSSAAVPICRSDGSAMVYHSIPRGAIERIITCAYGIKHNRCKKNYWILTPEKKKL
mmetsp:Transcript_21972/g.32693  ORF Transcript_21972/g.32693 Transcript_21972/m.32693 type:complete len:269 (+) Transcript_21972:1960-2766(+)